MQFEMNQNPPGISVVSLVRLFEQMKQCVKESDITDMISTMIFFF